GRQAPGLRQEPLALGGCQRRKLVEQLRSDLIALEGVQLRGLARLDRIELARQVHGQALAQEAALRVAKVVDQAIERERAVLALAAQRPGDEGRRLARVREL